MKTLALSAVLCSLLFLLTSCGWVTLSDPGETGSASAPPSSASQDPAPSADEQAAQPVEETPPQETPGGSADAAAPELSLKYGELLELKDNRGMGGAVIVKAKISPNVSNDLTVAQNYHNVVDLIQNHGLGDCELQYWAVADMADGSENKVVSFTVPADLAAQVASGGVTATQLPDLVADLWILPSLQK